MKKQTKQIMGTAAVGMGIAATGAAAYLLFGPNGKKNQKAVKGWAIKMKGEIIEKFETAKEVTEPIYHNVIDQISNKYSKMANISEAELAEEVKNLKKHWKSISKDMKGKKGAKKGKKK